MICGWSASRKEVIQEMRPYMTFRDDLVVIDSMIFKGRHIILPGELQKQALNQLHSNHMDTDKNKVTST